jgi:cobalamin biosynthesis protein CobT
MAKTKVKKKVISQDLARELSSRMRNSITIQNGIHLADRRRPPGIGFYEDSDMYFDPHEQMIHLGIFGPLDIFEVESEEEYVSALEFLYGHENQHVRSTAKIPYENGIKRAVQTIVEWIAAKEGIRKNFRNEKDYEVFVQKELPTHDIHVNYGTLVQICAHIMNSVEDGRIERIRSLEFPGFERQRRYFRALEWNNDTEFKPFSEGLNAEEKLGLYIGSIHSLATKGLYLKGFVAEYGGTEIMEEVKSFIPYVGKAVLATRTRGMADNVVKLAKLLAPYIYEVSKKSDAQRMFEEMMNALLAQMIGNLMDPSKMSDTSEREEEVDDGIPNSVFPMSDMVITLDDETYDKLMEKMKESGKNGGSGGIMIRREHPKDEEEQKKEGQGNGSGNASDKKDDAKEGAGSSSSNEQKSDKSGQQANSQSGSGQSGEKKDGQNGNQSQSGGEQGNGQANNASGDNNSSSQNPNGESQGAPNASKESQPYDKTYSRQEGGSAEINSSNQGSHQSGGGEGGTDAMVMDAMRQAAQECREDVNDLMTNINNSIQHTAKTNRGNAPIVKDTSKPITPEEVKDICSRGFEEKKRMYKLDQQLPPVLNARAKSFRKKNERYFKSLSTPNVSHLDSGVIDPTRIYGLAMGETDVFRKIGIDKNFDGCVYLLVDNSGSMSGNKRTEACKAAAVIEEGFKGIIPMKIVAFDTCGPIIHEVIKGWDESQKLNCCWNFAKHGRNGCGNDDAKDILVAQRELLSRPEEKKLLIVLSDGAPSSVEQTRQAIDDTRKKGINVFGIYFEEGQIGSDAKEFQYMYQKDYVCCELSDVDTELTKLMVKFSRS